jgi:hypothetical protein
MVVDDADEPHRHDGKHPHHGQIEPLEPATPPHVDAPGMLATLFLQRDDEIATADEDLAKGLAGGREAEDAGSEPAQLSGAEVGLLDV